MSATTPGFGEAPFWLAVRQRVATVAIGASTLRNVGAPGVVAAARQHLATVDLRPFTVHTAGGFRAALDRSTQDLMQALPDGTRFWGVARKGLNIFLRDAFYNWYLRSQLDLSVAEPFFETPLDGIVAKRLRDEPGGNDLPAWPGVKHLDPTASDAFQDFSSRLARKHGTQRVHWTCSCGIRARPEPGIR